MSVCDEDVDLQSWGWTDLSSYTSAASGSEREQQTAIMSRRSLRLDDGLLDRSLPHSSASFSVGGASWRSTRLLKARRSQQLSASCSESLLLSAPRQLLNSSLHSAASDASLLSSLLDESSVQESTLVDTFWGLDHDNDPKESTIIAEQSTVLADRTLIGSDGRCPKHLVQTLSRVHCNDCEPDRKSTYCPPTPESGAPQPTTIYCRGRSRKSRTGVLVSMWDRLAACVVSLLSLLYHLMKPVTGVRCVRRAAARCVSVLTHTWQVCRGLGRPTARSGSCGVMNLKELHPNGSLCDDCKEKQRSETDGVASSSWSKLASCLLGLMWSAAAVTGRTAAQVCRCFYRRWRRVTPSFLLIWFPLGLVLVFVPLLLLFTVNITEWRAAVSSVPGLSSFHSLVSPAEGAVEESSEVEHLYSRPPPTPSGEQVLPAPCRVQQQDLWRQQRLQNRHQQDLLHQQDLWRQQQSSRLDQLEVQLQALAASSQSRQEAATTVSPSTPPPADRVGVDPQSHDALLAEVVRLEAALEDVRRDVQGLSGIQDCSQQLATVQQAVSAQVREEVRTLVYGNQLTVRGGASADGGGLQESLLQWLSQQYISGADLQRALADLELRILRNVSLQVEQVEQRRGDQAVREAVLPAAGAVTPEDVHLMVTNALRLFSQDRTGLADYALESGGGSILSTRCSETYKTKAALLSLFGVPLWYFSQSPRVVIQPDVQPGNCWAFRGSTGFLVIRLSMRIVPTAFSLEHIPRALAPSRTLRSAPRHFSVYGLDDESQEGGELLGSYSYDQDGEALQTFSVTEQNDRAFQIIEVQVLSNWGHEEFTCMYRFRVHGTPGAV